MTIVLESDVANMLIREEDLRSTVGSRIASITIGIALAALGLAIKVGIVDISVLVEAWSDHALSVFTVWWSYSGVGAFMIIGGLIPSKYKNARLYEDKLELTKKESMTYSFNEIFDVSANKQTVRITFKDGTAQVSFSCRNKSTFPQEVVQLFTKWKESAE